MLIDTKETRIYRTRLYRNPAYIEAVCRSPLFRKVFDISKLQYHGPLSFELTGFYCKYLTSTANVYLYGNRPLTFMPPLSLSLQRTAATDRVFRLVGLMTVESVNKDLCILTPRPPGSRISGLG